jgi:hypothetical protein
MAPAHDNGAETGFLKWFEVGFHPWQLRSRRLAMTRPAREFSNT